MGHIPTACLLDKTESRSVGLDIEMTMRMSNDKCGGTEKNQIKDTVRNGIRTWQLIEYKEGGTEKCLGRLSIQ